MADVGSDNLKPKIITLKVLIGGISESDDNPWSALYLLSKQVLIPCFASLFPRCSARGVQQRRIRKSAPPNRWICDPEKRLFPIVNRRLQKRYATKQNATSAPFAVRYKEIDPLLELTKVQVGDLA
jgi:hypothetical protein